MREIKFRGKRLDIGKWVYGSLLLLNDQAQIFLIGNAPLVNPTTVGQFIGLKDKNGVEIYEGDIVRFYDDTEDEMCNGEVMYSADYSGFFIAVPHRDAIILNIYWEWEVVGNIHDNPELMKGGDE